MVSARIELGSRLASALIYTWTETEATVLLEEPETFDSELIQEEREEAKKEAEKSRPGLTMFTDELRLEDGAAGYTYQEKKISHWERVHAPSACNAFTENPLLRTRGFTQSSVATKNIRNNADINHFRYQHMSRSLTKTPYYERDPIV